MKKIDNLHKMVSYFLRENEDLRNDDISLQMALIRHKFPHTVKTDSEGQEYVAVWALRRITQDNVKRVRAKIQNEDGLYLPTDPEVRKARKISEDKWLDWVRATRPPTQYWNDTH